MHFIEADYKEHEHCSHSNLVLVSQFHLCSRSRSKVDWYKKSVFVFFLVAPCVKIDISVKGNSSPSAKEGQFVAAVANSTKAVYNRLLPVHTQQVFLYIQLVFKIHIHYIFLLLIFHHIEHSFAYNTTHLLQCCFLFFCCFYSNE